MIIILEVTVIIDMRAIIVIALHALNAVGAGSQFLLRGIDELHCFTRINRNLIDVYLYKPRDYNKFSRLFQRLFWNINVPNS